MFDPAQNLRAMRYSYVMLAVLAGCAGAPELVKVRHVDETNIRWVRGIEPSCGGESSPQGCADWSKSPCIITMKEDAPDWVVAHEVRHCFGYVHKQK